MNDLLRIFRSGTTRHLGILPRREPDRNELKTSGHHAIDAL
ncbi:hypothetical protein ACKFKF_12300 [Phormidesmis sp. 146-12]